MTAGTAATEGCGGARYPRQDRNMPQGDVKTEGGAAGFVEKCRRQGLRAGDRHPVGALTRDGNRARRATALTDHRTEFHRRSTNGRMYIKDIFRPGVTSTGSSPSGETHAGAVATLEAAGHVTPHPVRLSDGREFPVRLSRGCRPVDWSALDQKPATLRVSSRLPSPCRKMAWCRCKFSTREARSCGICSPPSAGERRARGAVGRADHRHLPQSRRTGPAGKYTWRRNVPSWHRYNLARLGGSSGQRPWDGPRPGDNWGGDMGTPCTVPPTVRACTWVGAARRQARRWW